MNNLESLVQSDSLRLRSVVVPILNDNKIHYSDKIVFLCTEAGISPQRKVFVIR